jgi:hypothetical protein
MRVMEDPRVAYITLRFQLNYGFGHLALIFIKIHTKHGRMFHVILPVFLWVCNLVADIEGIT